MTALSVLDLAPIAEGRDAGDALRNALDLAQNAERFGYKRFWMAERAGCTVTEYDAGHLGLLSEPKVVVDVIAEAARAAVSVG